MNNRLLTVIGVIMVFICVGIGILVFRPTPIIVSRASALDPQTVVKDHTISVSGEGKYKMKPDVAYVELGVYLNSRRQR